MKSIYYILIFLGCFVATSALSQQTNIVFIGNSITDGAFMTNRDTEAPPAHAVRWMKEQQTGEIDFRNCGVSGHTTVSFLPSATGGFSNVKNAADELSKKPGTLVFSVMLGTNDSAIKGPLGAPVLPSEYYTNLKAIADELLKLYPASLVVFNRPIWYSPTTQNNSVYLQEGLDRLQAYYPVLKQLVSDYDATHPGQVYLGDTAAFNFFREKPSLYVTEKGKAGTFYLHPNKEGAKKLGELWGNAIINALRTKPASKEYPMNTVHEIPAMDTDTAKGMLSPSLRVFLPDSAKATGRMVIALPGGGYQGLAVFHEGFDWAPYFLSKGIALAVLKYRMPKGDRNVPFADVKAAFDFVKQHASEWKVNPNDIGIMGSSAGGHLASTYATHTKGADKPAFQILLYPVITMDPSFTHAGSRKNLLGENPSQEITDSYSNEKQVTAETPRAFVIFAADDKIVPPANGFRYVETLQKNNVPITFLLYPTGGHGFGNSNSFAYKQQFMQELSKWLESF